MPRYFFHVFNSESVLDQDGIELPDGAAALSVGRRAVADLMREQVVAGEKIDPAHRLGIVEPDSGSKVILRFGEFFLTG